MIKKKEAIFNNVQDVQSYLFKISEKKLYKNADKLFSTLKYFHRLEWYNYDGLMHVGPILLDVESVSVVSEGEGLKLGYNQFCATDFILSMGLARKLSRLVIIMHAKSTGATFNCGYDWLNGCQLNTVKDDLYLDKDLWTKETNDLIDFFKRKTNDCKGDVLREGMQKEYLMSFPDMNKILYDASNYDLG